LGSGSRLSLNRDEKALEAAPSQVAFPYVISTIDSVTFFGLSSLAAAPGMVCELGRYQMKARLFLGLLAATTLSISAGNASTIIFGLQEAGFNSGNIQVEGSPSSTGSNSITAVSFGTWTVNTVTAEDVTVLGLPSILNSNAQDISSTTAGTLKVYVTDTGLTVPLDSVDFKTDFAVNDLAHVSGATLTSYFSQSNLPFATTTQIDSQFFAAIGSATGTGETVPGVTAPYSITEVYTLTSLAGLSGNTNLTIDLNGVGTVPEPATWAMMLAGFASLGFAGYRKARRGEAFAA
jgi:hypothetical protein